MKLLVQPGDGIAALIKGIDRAKETIDIVIFRLDISQIEHALVTSVSRGVRVRALIAWTNRGGEKNLRTLETRFLAAGITVARTADDLVRYHGKMMIVDNRELYVLGFNFSHIDIEHSRSFGIVTSDTKLITEAARLFEADSLRQTFTAGNADLVVSPVNARRKLAEFIRGARKNLWIYDQELSDSEMIGLLDDMSAKGVAVRLIGKDGRAANLQTRRLIRMRQHARLIVRDGSWVFLGSQSLRALELDKRREIGVIFRDAKIAARLMKIFNEDWNHAEPVSFGSEDNMSEPVRKIAKAVARQVVKDLPPVAPVVETAAKEVAGEPVPPTVDRKRLQEELEGAVRSAVKEVVRDALESALGGGR